MTIFSKFLTSKYTKNLFYMIVLLLVADAYSDDKTDIRDQGLSTLLKSSQHQTNPWLDDYDDSYPGLNRMVDKMISNNHQRQVMDAETSSTTIDSNAKYDSSTTKTQLSYDQSSSSQFNSHQPTHTVQYKQESQLATKSIKESTTDETVQNTKRYINSNTQSEEILEVKQKENQGTKPESKDTLQEESVEQKVLTDISAIKENISNLFINKPFKDFAGYLNTVNDFDANISCIDTNTDFPGPGEFSIKQLKGNVVIIFFTKVWCHFCTPVFKDLDALSRELDNKQLNNIKIIPILLSDDSGGYLSNEVIDKYYNDHEIESLHKFTSLKSKDFTPPLDIIGVPTCIVFNKKSVPVWGFSGITNYKDQAFLNFLETLSKED